MNKLLQQFLQSKWLFAACSVITLTALLGFWGLNSPRLILPVLGLATVMITVVGFKQLYWLLLFCLPLSFEFEVGRTGLATDLPTEPLMILLMLAAFFYFFANPTKINKQLFRHPLLQLVIAHLIWLIITTIYSSLFVVSFKFLLAKTWYIVTFLWLTHLFIQKEKDFKIPFWCMAIPFFLVVLQTIIRHISYDFSFEDVNKTMQPFFRNHVNYAVMTVAFLPFIFHAKKWYKQGTINRLFLNSYILVSLIGIAFAFTRSAYLCLLIMPMTYYIIRNQLTKFLATIGIVVLIIGSIYINVDNKYLEFAPDFETTIYHADLDGHLTATLEGNDLSFMERVYRWVAALHMCKEHPVVGFGPGNFYNFYKSYTVASFETYVSDNKEKSGVHNYFLMTLVEQGFIGMLIFFALCVTIFIKGTTLYHQLAAPLHQSFVMAILLSSICIVFNLFLNDLIEVDKTGSLFFMNIAMLVSMDKYKIEKNIIQ